MDKPGRNDPCYCGSGKKYKQCHMAADMAAENEQRAWADAARYLRADLIDFADDERFDAAVDAALPGYWADYYTAETEALMSPSEEERFFDWFIFDHAPEAGGPRVIELYQTERGPRLSQTQQALLEKWVKAPPLTAYEYAGHDGQTLRLRDFLTGETASAFVPIGPGQMPSGALVLTRLLPVAERLEFGTLPAYIPPDEIADLKASLDAKRAAAGNTPPDVFMREHNVLLVHHALEQAKLAGRPPVTRLDPRHNHETVQNRTRHERLKIKGPARVAENLPAAHTHRKAI